MIYQPTNCPGALITTDDIDKTGMRPLYSVQKVRTFCEPVTFIQNQTTKSRQDDTTNDRNNNKRLHHRTTADRQPQHHHHHHHRRSRHQNRNTSPSSHDEIVSEHNNNNHHHTKHDRCRHNHHGHDDVHQHQRQRRSHHHHDESQPQYKQASTKYEQRKPRRSVRPSQFTPANVTPKYRFELDEQDGSLYRYEGLRYVGTNVDSIGAAPATLELPRHGGSLQSEISRSVSIAEIANNGGRNVRDDDELRNYAVQSPSTLDHNADHNADEILSRSSSEGYTTVSAVKFRDFGNLGDNNIPHQRARACC